MNQPKRLYRSKKQRMVAGICGGMAEYLNIDPVIVRCIAVVLLIVTFPVAGIAYLILWAIIPEKPAVKAKASKKVASSKTTKSKAAK